VKKGPFNFMPTGARPPGEPKAEFDEFEATELYCPKCGRAVRVRKSLLLILPEGDKYEYRCQHCGTTVGDKMDRSGQFYGILKT
jgi:DNA-directed RNA polymerase subunit RPC12/RpoP